MCIRDSLGLDEHPRDLREQVEVCAHRARRDVPGVFQQGRGDGFSVKIHIKSPPDDDVSGLCELSYCNYIMM